MKKKKLQRWSVLLFAIAAFAVNALSESTTGGIETEGGVKEVDITITLSGKITGVSSSGIPVYYTVNGNTDEKLGVLTDSKGVYRIVLPVSDNTVEIMPSIVFEGRKYYQASPSNYSCTAAINVEDLDFSYSLASTESGMSLSNVSHTINGDIITLRWTAVRGNANVRITVFDIFEESFVTVDDVSIADQQFTYTATWNGEHIFRLQPMDGGTEVSYTATVSGITTTDERFTASGRLTSDFQLDLSGKTITYSVNGTSYSVLTDADGAFRISDLRKGSRLEVQAPDITGHAVTPGFFSEKIQGNITVSDFKYYPISTDNPDDPDFEIVNGVLISYNGSDSDVVIPDGVTVIGNDAFLLSDITSVVIPNTVTSIGESAFMQCQELTTLTIPESVTVIEAYAFLDCNKLQTITVQWTTPPAIPSGVFNFNTTDYCILNVPRGTKDNYTQPSLLWSFFKTIVEGGDNSDFEIVNGVLIGYNGPGGDVVIPTNGVTAIGNDAFLLSDITSVVIPNTVTSIGENAFTQCRGLTTLTIPESVTTIGEWAFWNCSNLNTITVEWTTPPAIPENVFDSYVMAYCTLSVPEGTMNNYKEDDVWGGFEIIEESGLEQLTLSCSIRSNILVAGETWNVSYDGTGTFSDDNKFILQLSDETGSFNAPTEIGSCNISGTLIYGSSIHFTIPETIVLGNKYRMRIVSTDPEFISNDNGADITIIGANEKILTCSINSSEMTAGQEYYVSYDATGKFNNSDNFRVQLSDENGSFDNYTDLYDDLGSHVVSGEMHRNGAISVIIPSSIPAGDKYRVRVVFIDPEFIGEDNGTDLTIVNNNDISDFEIVDGVLIKYHGQDENVVIPDGVHTIGGSAFFWNTYIRYVTIPNSVIIIGESAFGRCSNLVSINIPATVDIMGENIFSGCGSLLAINVDDENTVFSSEDGVLFNKSKTSLTIVPCGKSGSYSIPNTVSIVEDNAFFSCSKLTSINIPNSVNTMEESPFYTCYGLISIDVDIENDVFSSEDGVFYSKDKKTLITYPSQKVSSNYSILSTATLIKNKAFNYCDHLTSITIPKAINQIEKEAFVACSNLNTVRLLMPVPIHVASDIFERRVKISEGTLIVPFGTKSLYEAADVWKDFGTIIESSVYAEEPEPAAPGGQGQLDLVLSIPNNETLSGSFFVTLPEGFALNLNLTSLASELTNDYTLSITALEANKWQITITPKVLRNGSSYSYQKIVNLVYDIQNDVIDGTYPAVISDLNFEFGDGSTITEEAIDLNITVRSYTDVTDTNYTRKVYVQDGNLYIDTPVDETISVYTVSGDLLFTSQKQTGISILPVNELSSQVLIVKGSSGWSEKLMVY